MTTTEEKVRENRLRRMAERQGLVLQKSRRRDPRALDYGAWWIIDAATNLIVSTKVGADLDAIERYLNGERDY